MRKNFLKHQIALISLVLLFAVSCKKDVVTSEIFIKKQWKVDLSTSNIVPFIQDRTGHAVAVLYLMDNNEFYYNIYFDKALANGDNPTGIKLCLGTAGQNGNILIDFQSPGFNPDREAKGKLTLDAATINSLLTQSTYISVASSKQADGLVRGQLK